MKKRAFSARESANGVTISISYRGRDVLMVNSGSLTLSLHDQVNLNLLTTVLPDLLCVDITAW